MEIQDKTAHVDKADHIADIKDVGLDAPTSPNPKEEFDVNLKSNKDAVSQDPEAQDENTQPNPAPLHSVFTSRQRLFIIIMTTLAAFFSPLSGQIYFPAIPDLATAYHTTTGRINLTITTYMILQGLAPTIMGSFGDGTGRRPAYITTFLIYFAANVGLATQRSYAALLVLRCIQSAGSSGTVALAYGVVADVSTAAERGKYLGPVAAGAMMAPAIGPTIGGLLARYLGWRAIFWFLTIISGVYLIVYVLFMPETSRKVVGDGSIPPDRWYNMSLMQWWNARKQSKTEAEAQNEARQQLERPKFQFPNPWHSIRVLGEKDILLVILFISVGMISMISLLASMPPIFQEIYGFSSLQVGLCYIPFGVSACLAAVFNGKLMDFNYRRWAKKYNLPLDKKRKVDLRNFPIEKVRLQVVFVVYPALASTVLCWGWVLERRANLAAPLILGFIAGFCLVACSNTMSSLLVDLYPEKPATVTAANNLVRCWLGGAAAAVLSYMLNGMGWGWCFVFFGLLQLLALLLLWPVWKWGMQWREQRFVKLEDRKKREEEQKQSKKESKSSQAA